MPADPDAPTYADVLASASDPELRKAAYEAMAPRELEGVVRRVLVDPDDGCLARARRADGRPPDAYFMRPDRDAAPFQEMIATMRRLGAIISVPCGPGLAVPPEWAEFAAAGHEPPAELYLFYDDVADAPERYPRGDPRRLPGT